MAVAFGFYPILDKSHVLSRATREVYAGDGLPLTRMHVNTFGTPQPIPWQQVRNKSRDIRPGAGTKYRQPSIKFTLFDQANPVSQFTKTDRDRRDRSKSDWTKPKVTPQYTETDFKYQDRLG